MKYDVDKEKEQTQLALLQNAKEKQEKTVYLGLVIFSIIIFSVIIYIILANRKKKQLETIFNTETRISKKLHDELANDTFQVMAQLQALPEIPEEIIDELDLIYSKTRNISRDHNPIYEHTDFYEQLTTMLAAYKSDDFNVIVKNDQKIEWETLNPLKKKTVYIVLKELMTNNRKHSRSNFALISFSQKGNKLNIAYKDNGIGGDLKKNNGLQNLEYRIKALKGKIDFNSEKEKGFKVDILI
ncbi:sensor histidine kinase [Leeuwenhoekiella sp. A2]